MGFAINRGLGAGVYGITRVFSGLDDLVILETIFGGKDRLASVLESMNVKIIHGEIYMYVDDEDPCVVVGLDHLQKAEEKILYLDIIHELVHVKQLMDGMDLYDERYSYVDRPTEIDAYRVVVEEARKLGMKEDEILDYLRVDWITEEELRRLVGRLGITA